MSGVHIDKVSKDVNVDLESKPVGAVQWDFILSIPDAADGIIRKFSSSPETVFFYITSKCGSECKGCQMPMSKDMELDGIKKIIQELKDIGTKYVILEGNPASREDFFDILDELNKKDIQVSVNVDTKITREEILKIKEKNVKKLQFRLAGLESLHSEYRNNFQDVLESIKLCKDHGLYSSVIFSISKKNVSEIDKLIDFCKENSIGQFSFIRLPCCPFLAVKDFVDSDEFLELSKKLVALRKCSEDVHITSNDPIWKGCGACLTSCTILPDGRVTPCNYLRIKAFHAGTIKDIWSSGFFRDMREGKGLKGKCGKCRYKILCKGCRAVALAQNGDYLSEDSACWL